MRIRERMNINDLYFGVRMMTMSYSSRDERTRMVTYNLFDVSRVKWSVAKWVTMSDEDKRRIMDPLAYMFFDVCGRTEYEMIVCPWPYNDGETVADAGQKVDVYEMYVKPNRMLLLDMVSRVSKSSANAYLREWRKKYRR